MPPNGARRGIAGNCLRAGTFAPAAFHQDDAKLFANIIVLL
jgi:hypothetical protein